METNKIQQLVFSFLDSIGVNRRISEEGIYHAIVPPEERPFFNGYEEYSFTFERHLAEKHRELELICEGSYLLKKIIERLSSIPKVSRLYSTAAPELPSHEPGKSGELVVLTPGKVHYRQKIIFTFKVTYHCDHRLDRLYSAVAEATGNDVYLSEGLQEVDAEGFKETADPNIILEESGEEMLRLYLQACRKLEAQLSPRIDEVRTTYEEKFVYEAKKVEAFLADQKRELLQKKENVCFHLYFFQKEEEIERMIRDLEADHQRKIDELREKFRVKVEINLLNAVVLCIPTLGLSASYLTRKKRETHGGLLPGLPVERASLPAF